MFAVQSAEKASKLQRGMSTVCPTREETSKIAVKVVPSQSTWQTTECVANKSNVLITGHDVCGLSSFAAGLLFVDCSAVAGAGSATLTIN